MYPTLRDFVEALERDGQLTRVRAPVSPVLEAGALADAQSKRPAPRPASTSAQRNDPRFHHLGGRALLLENVQRPDSLGGGAYDMPVAINLWGSYRRMEMALGCHDELPAPGGTRVARRDRPHTPGGFDAIGCVIGSLVKPEPPRSFGELVSKAKQFLPLLRIPPKRRRGLGLCQEVVHTGEQIDLRRLPIIRCWQHDGDFASLGYPPDVNDHVASIERGEAWDRDFRGRYITLAGIHTIHADDRDNPKPASHNIGMYRVQLFGRDRLAMHWHMHHDGARHWRSWKARGEPMPVAIVLGGESVMPYAATAPLPPGISELLLAGFLNRGGIPMVRGRTVPLWVPANAEIVIEGFVRTDAGFIDYDPRRDGPLGPGAVFEGPFGDHTGFYSLPDRYPLVEVSAITTRRDPIYPTTIVGLPPQEDYFLGKATERVFFPLLKTLIHDIEDYDLPMFGAFHNCAAIKIRKAYPMQGRRVMHSIWGAGQMAWTKTIFVVDDDVDVHDTMGVLRSAGERCHPLRDIETVHGPLDILDHAAPRLGAGMKIGFDCTRKRDGEQLHGVGVSVGPGVTVEAPMPVLAPRSAECEAYLRLVHALPSVVGARVIEAAPAWMLVQADKTIAGIGRAVIESIWSLSAGVEAAMLPRFVVVVGRDADLADADVVLFHWCAHTDASRDMYRWASSNGRVQRVAFDATPKLPGDERNHQPARDWPPMLAIDAQVARRVKVLRDEIEAPEPKF
jgi:4-hydroxy-3-polyprenylbenzoate decarboxylase